MPQSLASEQDRSVGDMTDFVRSSTSRSQVRKGEITSKYQVVAGGEVGAGVT